MDIQYFISLTVHYHYQLLMTKRPFNALININITGITNAHNYILLSDAKLHVLSACTFIKLFLLTREEELVHIT